MQIELKIVALAADFFSVRRFWLQTSFSKLSIPASFLYENKSEVIELPLLLLHAHAQAMVAEASHRPPAASGGVGGPAPCWTDIGAPRPTEPSPTLQRFCWPPFAGPRCAYQDARSRQCQGTLPWPWRHRAPGHAPRSVCTVPLIEASRGAGRA